MFLVNNIIQMPYSNRNVTKMPECQTEHTSQTLHFLVLMPVVFGVDSKWQPKAAHSFQEEHFQLLGMSAPLHPCHVSEGTQSWLKPEAFNHQPSPVVPEWVWAANKLLDPSADVRKTTGLGCINLTDALTQFFPTKGRGSKWWCIGWQCLIWSITCSTTYVSPGYNLSDPFHLSLSPSPLSQRSRKDPRAALHLSELWWHWRCDNLQTERIRSPLLQFHTLILHCK